MEGYALGSRREESSRLPSWLGRYKRMLQWKPKAIGVVSILVLVAAVSGQFTWDAFVQFTWF
jgi:hypothetical protein